jgi:hypothetical protein
MAAITQAAASTTSPGLTWTAISDTPFGSNAFSSGILGIAYGGGKFVVGGYDVNSNDSRMAYSADGITWTAVTDTTFDNSIAAIAYGGGKFVAGANGGKIAYSDSQE